VTEELPATSSCMFCGAPSAGAGRCPSCGHDVAAELVDGVAEVDAPAPAAAPASVAPPAKTAPVDPPAPAGAPARSADAGQADTWKLVLSWFVLIILILCTYAVAILLVLPALMSSDRAMRRAREGGRPAPKNQNIVAAAVGSLAATATLLAAWLAPLFVYCGVIELLRTEPFYMATIAVVAAVLLSGLAPWVAWVIGRRGVENAIRPPRRV